MKKHPVLKPTDAELEILQLLWVAGPSPVRQLNDELSKKREVVYTTTLKLLQIMHEKGLVRRDDSARSHVYEAAVRETDIQNRLLDQFVDTAFRGSAMKLVMQALGNQRVTQEELDAIKALIATMERE
jgi:predicted transcriptional regulator